MPLISTVVPIIGNYCWSLDFDYRSQIRRCYITITAVGYITIVNTLNFQNYLAPFDPKNIGFNCILSFSFSCSPGYSLFRIDSVVDIAVQMGFIRWNIGLP